MLSDFEDQIPIVGPPSFLFARELLGAEYMEAGRADSAAVQFQRVLAHVPNRSASLLGLARARVASGDRDAAIKSYTQLLTIWKRADADVPALAEVRAGAAGRFTPAAVGGNDAFKNEPGVHNAKNTGTTPVKILAIYLVEKGNPLAEPVP